MVKRLLLYVLLAACVFSGCQDDEATIFEVEAPDGFSHKAIAGGAILYYQLPKNKEVMSIKVRYTNAQGEEVLRQASYACDSIELIGFNEAQENVEAMVTLCDRNNVESEPVRVNFSTLDSGPVAFFDKLEVTPGWNGFNMSWDVPQGAKGLVHIFYMGQSPFVTGMDTLLVGTYVFNEGKGNLMLEPKQDFDTYDIIIRTEDFAGYAVKQKEWKNIAAYEVEQLSPENFEFTSPIVPVLTQYPTAKTGIEYLFDGNTKGVYPAVEGVYNTFLAGPHAFGKPFVVDFKTVKQIAQVKLYAMLNIPNAIPAKDNAANAPYREIWAGEYQNKLPNSVTLYGTNDADPLNESSWVEIGNFEDNVDKSAYENWWCRYTYRNWKNELVIMKSEEFDLAEPISMTINVPTSADQYRYLIMVVNDAKDGNYPVYPVEYTNTQDVNAQEYVTFHELEIYTKAESKVE